MHQSSEYKRLLKALPLIIIGSIIMMVLSFEIDHHKLSAETDKNSLYFDSTSFPLEIASSNIRYWYPYQQEMVYNSNYKIPFRKTQPSKELFGPPVSWTYLNGRVRSSLTFNYVYGICGNYYMSERRRL